MEQAQEQNRLSKFQKFNYALGDFSSNIMIAVINFYLLYFIINVGGISPFYASVIFLTTKFFDGFSDYVMGLICDHTMSRKGRRRLYMLVGAIPLGLSFPLLFIVPNTSVQLLKCIYYFSMYSLLDTFWTMVYVPYNSLLANISDDYDERTSVNGWRVTFANIGMIAGSALFPLFADGAESLFYRIFGNEKQAFFFASLLFGIVSAVLIFFCALKIKEHPCSTQPLRISPFKTLKEFFSLKEFRNTLLQYILAIVGLDILMSIYVFYLSDCIAITDSMQVMIFLLIPLIMATLSASFWVWLSKKYSKHRIYTISVVGIISTLLCTLLIPKKDYLALTGFCMLLGFFISAIQMLPVAAIPDVVEVGECKYGIRREGSYFGIVQCAYNISSGIALALVSLILGMFGYVENMTTTEIFIQPNSALWAIRGIFAFFPSVLFVLSAIFSGRINMNRARFNHIKQMIAARK